MTSDHVTGLAARAVSAARAARDADRDRFPDRYQDWHIWELRARRGRALAAALGVPVEWVSVIDDPQRVYGAVPGDLLIATDPEGGRRWRFVPDLGAAESWLLLDECPDCWGHRADDPDRHPRRPRCLPRQRRRRLRPHRGLP